ncbi:MAG: sulfate adenylyltransferase [Sphingobacteriales bacterium]|nr:MAG: sulfate adenylyltransferase [Sphingobacteriales bacterium]
MELLRIITAGSVDDGKSTLIGRLLYDSQSLLTDQLSALERSSKKKGLSAIDFSLLTDGLKDEIEQGITIDVAYRYFATGKRKCIIADTPGHVQYTRNFVTAASGANLALLLIDARKGVTEQTRRHSLIASLMGIKHLVFCINKMDLVDYQETIFEDIRKSVTELVSKLEIYDVRFIPMSALQGENLVHRSDKMPWYTGWGLLETLENTHISSDRNMIDGRFPVQTVIRVNTSETPDYRAYAGQVSSGVFRVGDEVVVMPSGFCSRISKIFGAKGYADTAEPPQSVSIILEDDIDVSRGNMIVKKNNHASALQQIDVMLCWLDMSVMQLGRRYVVRHTTQELKGMIKDVVYKINIDSFSRNEDEKELKMNDIARVKLQLSQPLLCDTYRLNRITGSLILIDEQTNNTVASGMIMN